MSAARKQKLAGLLARLPQVVFDRLPGLFGQLELDRPPRLALPDSRALDSVTGWGDILDFERHHVTTAQLAVDREIEHGEVSDATLNHQPRPDGPDVLCPQRGLGSDQLALVPGRAVKVLHQVCFILGHGRTPRLLRTGTMRGSSAAARNPCQLSESCGRVPFIGPPTLTRCGS